LRSPHTTRLIIKVIGVLVASIASTGWSATPGIVAGVAASAKNPVSTPELDQYASSRPCAGFYTAAFRPVIKQDRTPAPRSSRPEKGKRFSDPVYKTCVVRVTDAAKEPPSTFARNDYARRQAFNADDSLIIIYAIDGSWHLYDARTLKYVKKLKGVGGDAEPQWHSRDPRTLYYLANNGGMEIYALDVKTNQSVIAVDFSKKDALGFRVRDLWPDAARVWTRSEGSPSADGRYWAFQVEDNDFNILGLITYDMESNTILGKYATKDRPDHVSMSLSGKYMVVPWSKSDPEGGPVVFTRDMKSRRPLTINSGHSDLALDAEGNDVLVSVDHSGGYVNMTRLDTGKTTELFYIWPKQTTMAMHFSGKAFRKPGWVLLSTFGSGTTEWPHQKIFALELKANPRVVNLAHHHTVFGTADFSYFSQPHASTNRDMTRIVFNSNWDTPDLKHDFEHIDVYMIEIPEGIF